MRWKRGTHRREGQLTNEESKDGDVYQFIRKKTIL